MNAEVVEQALADYDAEIAMARERLQERLFGETSVEPEQAPTVEGEWQFIEERAGERYPWPSGWDDYDQFWVYESPDGRLFGVGKVEKGRGDRPFWMTFYLGSGGGSKRPVVLFMATDDFTHTGDAAAIIRGKGLTGKAMFGLADPLPAAYEGFKIQRYKDRVNPESGYSYDKAAVVVQGEDHVGMLKHAQAQVDLRGLSVAAA